MDFKLIDSHCHVHFRAYRHDMHEVVQKSLKEGVGMITVGTQSETSKAAVEIAEKYDGVWATIGLHPNHLHKQEFEDTNEIVKTRQEDFDPNVYEALVTNPKVVAIGEFGLDYYRLPPGVSKEEMVETQKENFREQAAFATEVGKPIIVHSRDSFDDQIALIKEAIADGGLPKRGVIHSFTGTAKEAQQYIDLGFYIGLNGILTFSKDLQNEVKDIPIESLLVETDAPYLTPPPHRGKRNEPQYIKFVAEKLAKLKNQPFEEVAKITNANTVKLFNLK